MKQKQKIVIGVVFFLILLGGICIGVFVKNFPILEFERKISVLETLTFIVTLAIGIVFPFLIKKWVDDNQTIKNYLVQEIEQLISEIKENKTLIAQSFTDGEFKSSQRDKINFTFHSTELQIESIQKQFEVSFPNSLLIVEDMKDSFRVYKDYLTGGELMISTFDKIELPFYREHSNEYNKFESHLKEMIHKIHRI
tara:strand:- start:30 stop:617 length:588 start_codon:yes stop_codon:yes gene_type:complete